MFYELYTSQQHFDVKNLSFKVVVYRNASFVGCFASIALETKFRRAIKAADPFIHLMSASRLYIRIVRYVEEIRPVLQ